MPKIKTNKQASKKMRVAPNGRVKRARAGTSHNTAKKTPKQRRQLRGTVEVSPANIKAVRKMLPYS